MSRRPVFLFHITHAVVTAALSQAVWLQDEQGSFLWLHAQKGRDAADAKQAVDSREAVLIR